MSWKTNNRENYQVLLLNPKPILERCRGLFRALIVLSSIQGNTPRESYENETRMLVGKLELNPKASWQSGCGLCLIRLRFFFTHNRMTIPLWLVWLKILNTENLHFLPLKKKTNISVTFKGEYPTPFTNLGGAKPCSKVVPRAASWNYTSPFSD